MSQLEGEKRNEIKMRTEKRKKRKKIKDRTDRSRFERERGEIAKLICVIMKLCGSLNEDYLLVAERHRRCWMTAKQFPNVKHDSVSAKKGGG